MSGRDGAWKMSDGSVTRVSIDEDDDEDDDDAGEVDCVSPSSCCCCCSVCRLLDGHLVNGKCTNAGSTGAAVWVKAARSSLVDSMVGER